MSMGYRGKKTNWPRDTVAVQAQMERESQWGELEGEVKSFDPQKQTATIQPLYKPRHNGEPVDMPELLEVPVRFPRAGNGAMTFPVQAGDKVTLRPKSRSSEKYHTEGSGEASDTRSFSLSDMEAHLDGGESLMDPIPNFDNSNVHMRFDPQGNFGVRGSKEGKIKIEGNQGNIYALVQEAVDLCGDGFVLLGTEATLAHQSEYADIGDQLKTIAGKLAGMAL